MTQRVQRLWPQIRPFIESGLVQLVLDFLMTGFMFESILIEIVAVASRPASQALEILRCGAACHRTVSSTEACLPANAGCAGGPA